MEEARGLQRFPGGRRCQEKGPQLRWPFRRPNLRSRNQQLGHGSRFDQCSISPLSLKVILAAGYVRMTVVQEATLPAILEACEVGVVSDKYRLALNLIREAEKFLLSDNTYEDTKPKIVSRIPKTNRPERINNQNIWKTFASQNGNDGRRVQQPLGKESKGSLGKLKESSVSNASLPGSNVAVPMNPQQFIGNQTMRSVVYMFPGALDPQMFGNAPMMPWLYQQMLQASQQPDAAPGARQAVKRRKIYRG